MSNPVFLLMPQWQGSASSRAMRIADGAAVIREDLPPRSTVDIAVPLEAGDAMGTPIARLSSLLSARDAARDALERTAGPHILVGGDGSTAVAGIEWAVRTHGADGLAVLWCDAHAGLEHPSTSPTGAAAGMALRHVLGVGEPELSSRAPASAARVSLLGTRATAPDEDAEITQLGISRMAAPAAEEAAAFADRISAHLSASGATRLYVHVDLDVLDPAEFSAVHATVPFGLGVTHLTSAIRAAVAALPLAGATITEFAPADAHAAADDLPTVLRILGALTSGGSGAAGAAA
ncbi:MAG: arginase family protein [Leucobacter sp.]